VFNNVFAWEGAVAVAGLDEAGMIGSHRFVTYTVDPKRSTPEFLNLFFKTSTGLEILLKASPGSAGRNKTLGLDRFIVQNIPLPPLAEQRRLVERIDALAGKIHEASTLRAEADDSVERFLMSMAHRSDLSPTQKAELGWRETTLGEVIKLRADPVTVRTTENYPNLGIYSFGKGLFKKSPIDGLATSANTLYRVHAGQFIYSRLFAFEGAYGVVTESYDGCFVSNEYPTFEYKPEIVHPVFLQAYFKAPRIWSEIAIGSKGLGDRRQRVHPEQILAHKLFLPPIAWQNTISEIQSKIEKEQSVRKKIRNQLDAMLPAILDRAFRGEL
jgi:type I restriction enzyme S subunit